MKKKIALVTGGGQGIGRGITECFLNEGAQVAVVQRRPLDRELDSHPAVLGIQADLTDPAVIPAIIQQTVGRFGGIDVLVNNAGIMFERSVSDIQVDEWDRMIALNMRAPLFLTQAVLPHMRKRGGGSIINIGSIEGLAANPEHTVYCASKAGIHGLTKALAIDLGADNIRCNAIAPGFVETDMTSYLKEGEQADKYKAGIPLGKFGTAEDIANVTLFLAYDLSSYVTGQVLSVDGGLYM